MQESKRGPKDQAGTILIYALVFMVRDITGKQFQFDKTRHGPAEFVRRAVQKAGLKLSEATIDNKLKAVLRDTR